MSVKDLLPQLLCSALEKVINSALSLDPKQAITLSQMEQQALTLQLRELGFELSFLVAQEQVMVMSCRIEHSCYLATDFATLPKLTKPQLLPELIKQGAIEIEGDVQQAQRFAQLGQSLDIDWQQQIAQHIGDIPTHYLSRLVHNVKRKARFAQRQIEQDASEYLLYEQPVLVNQAVIKDFNGQVEQLASDTKAIEQRINQLTTTLTAKE
ncbi:ubiquinone biosynthesis accessory factor UbiJ [Thalassotalea litorea]|uniref:ubiquinone biosynthesis accessory factor UbiJ n=1 Tax=Thalassotalea litorea TaxID=2020715 RepID=UPI00373661F3